jgi:hypothetical protein
MMPPTSLSAFVHPYRKSLAKTPGLNIIKESGHGVQNRRSSRQTLTVRRIELHGDRERPFSGQQKLGY